MKTADVQKLYAEYVLPTYTHLPVCLVKGKGSRVWDIEGKEYIDFFPGWAVSGLGHCPPSVSSAIKHQVNKMIHISNNYLNCKQAQLAAMISKCSFPSKAFFCNSGAEAIESAIKFARRYGKEHGKYEIITMEQSFHGRTLAALTATGQLKYQDGFDPLPQGFKYVKFNSIAALKETITPQTAAIILEPIQGEGGINVVSKEYIEAVKRICSKEKLLLIFDEVQTGMGRTGKMFAYQHFGIEPDLMTLAKSLGGGVPIGALVVNKKLKNYLPPGTHASTFGGNPLVTTAALAVFKTIKKNKLLKNAQEMGNYLHTKLFKLKEKYGFIKEIRGIGLMIGVECTKEGKGIVERCMEKGLLINCTQNTVLRIMPAITVNKTLINRAIRILDEAMQETI
ncbi:MAG: aspartate aminotransferase family protein [Candidatus Omnitrophica bacterium]|nr:aspartate aminotransferase family protein [Candidatus Omnitrophota bacterium]